MSTPSNINKDGQFCYGSCMPSYLPGGSDGKESACNAGNSVLIPWSARYPAEGNGYPAIFLSGKSHAQRSQADYSLWGSKESNTAEQLTLNTL